MDKRQETGELMTAAEAIAFLRLDSVGLKNPAEALRYLRRMRRIGANIGSVTLSRIFVSVLGCGMTHDRITRTSITRESTSHNKWR